MTKQYFMQMAALNLITANPSSSMQEIADKAQILSDILFKDEPAFTEMKQTWSDEIDQMPIPLAISHKCINFPNRTRLRKAFVVCNINTVGDLLRLGREQFKRSKGIGNTCMWQLDYALEDLGIEEW